MVTRKEDTPQRRANRKYEEKNKEKRKAKCGNFQTMIPRELFDKINEFLRFLYFFRSNTCLFHVTASPAYKRKSMFWPTIFSCGVIT